MDRIPILKLGKALLVTIQVDMHDRLATALQKHEERPLAEVARKVDRYVRNFCALAPRHDDRTLLLVRPR